MNSKSPESGLDELIRLSQQTARMGQDLRQKEQQEAEHYQKVQGVVQGLREISFSVALEQLKPVTTAEIIEKVKSLQNKQDTKELRRLITELARDLDKLVAKLPDSDSNKALVESSVKTLTVLISLLFSLQ
jgi:hypothetical protein